MPRLSKTARAMTAADVAAIIAADVAADVPADVAADVPALLANPALLAALQALLAGQTAKPAKPAKAARKADPKPIDPALIVNVGTLFDLFGGYVRGSYGACIWSAASWAVANGIDAKAFCAALIANGVNIGQAKIETAYSYSYYVKGIWAAGAKDYAARIDMSDLDLSGDNADD